MAKHESKEESVRMGELRSLPNIGPELERQLHEVQIDTVLKLNLWVAAKHGCASYHETRRPA